MMVFSKKGISDRNQRLVCLVLKRQSKAIVWHRLNSSLYSKRAKCFSTEVKSEPFDLKKNLDVLKELQQKTLVILNSSEFGIPELTRSKMIKHLESFDFSVNYSEDYALTEDFLEKQIVQSQKMKQKLEINVLLTIKQKLEERLGIVGKRVFQVFLESIFFHATEFYIFDKNEENEFELYLNPLFVQIFTVVLKEILPFQEMKTNLGSVWDINFETQKIKDEIEKHKKTRKKDFTAEQKEKYDIQLKKLNNRLTNLKKRKLPLIQENVLQPITKADEEIFADTMSIFVEILFSCGLTMETRSIGYTKRIRVLRFPSGSFKPWFNVWADLSNKPMIEPPRDYVLNEDQTQVQPGGYQLTSEFAVGRMFITDTLDNYQKIHWDSELIEEINLLQSLPFRIDGANFSSFVKLNNEFFADSFEKLLQKLHQNGFANEYAFTEIKKLFTHIFKFFRLAKFLVWFLNGKAYRDVFFPLHIDRAFRLYPKGEVNYVNSKEFRLLLNFPYAANFEGLLPIEEKEFNWFAACQISKFKSFEAVPLKWVPQDFNNFRSKIKAFFYKNMIEDEPRKYLKPVWLDATSSSLQIQSLCFGIPDWAESLNLRAAGEHRDLITEWLATMVFPAKWTKKQVEAATERKILKYEVMVSSYGGTPFSSKERIKEFYPGDFLENERLEMAVFFRQFVHEKLAFILEFQNFIKDYHKVLFQTKPFVMFKNEGTLLEFRKVILKDCRISFQANVGGKKKQFRVNVEIPEQSKIDARGTLTKIPPLLTHSKDAVIARKLRVEIWKEYEVNIGSIHDGFFIPAILAPVVRQKYKDLLFKYCFDQNPFDPFCLDESLIRADEDLKARYKKLKQQIEKNKANPEWKKIRKEVSPFCLYPE